MQKLQKKIVEWLAEVGSGGSSVSTETLVSNSSPLTHNPTSLLNPNNPAISDAVDALMKKGYLSNVRKFQFCKLMYKTLNLKL